MTDTPTRPAPVVEPSAQAVPIEARLAAIIGDVFRHAHSPTQYQPRDCAGCAKIIPTILAALRSEPRPQPTSEELREKLDAYRDSVSRHTSTTSEYCDSCNRKRAAVERLFARSQERQ